MRAMIMFLAILLFASPISSQTLILRQKVEECRVVLREVQALESQPQGEITPEQARSVVDGLIRRCGYMTNFLARDILQAHSRGDISLSEFDEFWEASQIAWRFGPKYFELLQRTLAQRKGTRVPVM